MELTVLLSKISIQVRRAYRRILLQRFMRVLGWSAFATLLVSLIAIAASKIWDVGVDSHVWTYSWVGGALTAAFLVAMTWTFVTRGNELAAAIEIDRRFGLKERVSSSLAMGADQRQAAVGKALISDAARQVERIDVASGFPFRAGWRALMPLIPVLAVFAVVQLPSTVQKKSLDAREMAIAEKKKIRVVKENLKKKITDRKKLAAESGLKEVAELFDSFQQRLDKMADAKNTDRKKALSNLSDLGNALKNRRKLLGDSNQIKKQLNQLKDLKPGPGNQLAQAMKDGNIQQTLKELDKLKTQLQNGELSWEEQKQLADQMQQMADKLKQLADVHKRIKNSLQQKIDQAKNQGDQQLQQNLDQMNQQMDRLQQMVQQLDQCAQCLQQGQGQQQNVQQTLAQLDQLAGELKELQQADAELEMLDEALDELAQAKKSLNCRDCNGNGCAACMGIGGNMMGQPGMGMGEGRGHGPRSAQENKTNFFDSQVRANPKGGAAAQVDEVAGANVAGEAREEIQTLFEQAKGDSGNPLTGKRLPKSKGDHVLEYFESFREGE